MDSGSILFVWFHQSNNACLSMFSRTATMLAGLAVSPLNKGPSTPSSSSSSSSSQRYAAELFGLRKVFKGGRTPLACRPTFMCKPCMSPQADDDAGNDQLITAVTANRSSSDGGGNSRRWYNGRKRQEDFWAMRGTWLGIERGQLFCLLGPNGAGKTTTINCLTGGFVLFLFGGDGCAWGGRGRVGMGGEGRGLPGRGGGHASGSV